MRCERCLKNNLDKLHYCSGCGNPLKFPIGVMPEYIWIEMRVRDLKDAIHRYLNADKIVPGEWYDEIKKHIIWMQEREK